MADSWEDWETEEPVVPVPPPVVGAAAVDPVKAKFADEDAGEEEEPKWKANLPAPAQVGAAVVEWGGWCCRRGREGGVRPD